jgi:hypothetical protein
MPDAWLDGYPSLQAAKASLVGVGWDCKYRVFGRWDLPTNPHLCDCENLLVDDVCDFYMPLHLSLPSRLLPIRSLTGKLMVNTPFCWITRGVDWSAINLD